MIRVTVDLGDTPTLPIRLGLARERCLARAAEGTAHEIGRASQSSQIAAATHVTQLGETAAVVAIGEGVPFARIRDVGGTIEPRRGRVLRFASGEFRPKARQRGTRYVARAEQKLGGVVGEAFHASFSDLDRYDV